MELMPETLRELVPALYSTERDEDPVVHVKLFTPWAAWTWYVAEFDGEDVCFGLVHGFAREWGCFRLSELREIRGPGGLTVERDMHFEPTRASRIES